jgi:hypothetical protein
MTTCVTGYLKILVLMIGRVGGRRQKLSINEATIRQSKRARTASRS